MEDHWNEFSRGLEYMVVAMRARKIKSLDTKYM